MFQFSRSVHTLILPLPAHPTILPFVVAGRGLGSLVKTISFSFTFHSLLFSSKEQFALFPFVLSSILFLSLLRKNCASLSFFHVPAYSTYIPFVVAGRGLGSLVKTISLFASHSFLFPPKTFSHFLLSCTRRTFFSLSLSHSHSLTYATIFFVPLKFPFSVKLNVGCVSSRSTIRSYSLFKIPFLTLSSLDAISNNHHLFFWPRPHSLFKTPFLDSPFTGYYFQ